jgi:hypothetical protein
VARNGRGGAHDAAALYGPRCHDRRRGQSAHHRTGLKVFKLI